MCLPRVIISRMLPSQLKEWIKEQGRALGFDRVGIAPASDLPELDFFTEWKRRGYAGQLDYLHNPKRADVRRLLPEVRSVICCALNYHTQEFYSTQVPRDPARGWISRYAWGDDYHDIVAEKLAALRARIAEKISHSFAAKLYVDTGPVLERVYGKYAGLGWFGKNTCLLHPDLGSWFFLGVLVTNLDLPADEPLADGCGACTLCLEACPAGALVEPYVLDARRCISYLNIELRPEATPINKLPGSAEQSANQPLLSPGSIPVEFREKLGRNIFGCDICQDVCPWNQQSLASSLPEFAPRTLAVGDVSETHLHPAPAPQFSTLRSTGVESLFHPLLAHLIALSEEEFQRLFKKSSIKRVRWRGLLRNVLVAMGNSGKRDFRSILEKFASGTDPLLAEHARWALTRLSAR